MTDSFFTTGDGCKIAYRLDGPESAPVLLLSNSLGTTRDMWSAQMEAFSSTHRLLRYDSRGHGASQAPPGAYSIDRLGRDAVELVDHLGLARVDFCGLSIGGMVGQWLALRAPARLGRLVLANTSAFIGPTASWDDRIAAIRRAGLAAIAEAVVERWFTTEFQMAHPDAVAPVRQSLLATDVGGYAGCCSAIRDMDMRRAIALIDVPTLIICGDADPATPPPHSEQLAAAISGARLVRLKAAHLSNIEQPAPFAQAVIEFLSGNRRIRP